VASHIKSDNSQAYSIEAIKEPVVHTTAFSEIVDKDHDASRLFESARGPLLDI
jgi:hypothetical protein